MLNNELWETTNGVLSILGVCLILMATTHLVRTRDKIYHEPVRFVTLAFILVILGHTIKDSAAYLERCCGIVAADGWVIAAATVIGLGKLGCIRIWSEPSWGNWPWIATLGLIAIFLLRSFYS